MTEKLYYQDPYMKTFSAEILQCEKDDQGQLYVILDQTAFYPTGGGQPHDTGTLNGIGVYDVKEEEGEIRHYIDYPLEKGECTCEIDWDRRFDHMQQHAGQHILSAAFEDTYGYKTVGFHLGTEICTIDLEVPVLTETEVAQAEERANEVILENRPIEAVWVTEEEANAYPLRKAVAVSDNIRLVIISDFDYSGCGGTHPSETGQVCSLKVLHWEKQKKKVRLSFVCGNRVLKQLHDKHQVIQSLTDLLNAPQQELASTASHHLEQQKNLEKSIEHLQEELISYEAQKLNDQAILKNDYKLIKKVFRNIPAAKLRKLAINITQHSDRAVVLFINESDDKLQFVCGKGKELAFNMKDFVAEVLPEINGKGGGSEELVQGGGESIITGEKLLEKMVQTVEEMQSH